MSLHSVMGWERKLARETLNTTANTALLLFFVQCLYRAQQTETSLPCGEGPR